MAVQSVLGQTFDDFEIVISNGGSTDNTGEVVKRFDDPRIKYLESAERLSIGDNYQAGLDHASGEYITFLSDDDAFVPQMLERSLATIEKESIEVLVFKSCFYFQEPTTYLERELSENSLVVPPFSGKLSKFDGEEAARAVFGNFNIGTAQPKFNVSFLANAIYHRSVFSKISQRRPKNAAANTMRATTFNRATATMFPVIAPGFCVQETTTNNCITCRAATKPTTPRITRRAVTVNCMGAVNGSLGREEGADLSLGGRGSEFPLLVESFNTNKSAPAIRITAAHCASNSHKLTLPSVALLLLIGGGAKIQL